MLKRADTKIKTLLEVFKDKHNNEVLQQWFTELS